MEKKIDCLGLRDRPLGREANRINAEQRFVGAVSQKSFQARDHSRAPSLGRFQRCQPFLKRIFVNHSACSPELNLYNSKARKFAQKLPVTSDVGFCTAEPPMTVSYYCNKYRGSGRKQKKSTSFAGRYQSDTRGDTMGSPLRSRNPLKDRNLGPDGAQQKIPGG